MNEPLGPSTIEMLRYMHNNNEEDESNESSLLKLIIPVSIFEEYDKKLSENLQF